MDDPSTTPPRSASLVSIDSQDRVRAVSPSLLDPSSPSSPVPSWHDGAVTNVQYENSVDSELTDGTDSSHSRWIPGSQTLNLDLNDDASNSVRPQASQPDVNSLNEESNSVTSLSNDRREDELEGPPAKVRRLSSPSSDDADGETCPICLESWANSGEHRLVALKCGHLFGAKCVERWLRAQAARDRSCPTCKSKAALRDVRFIYAKRLVAADRTQITALEKQVELLQTEKSRVELELEKCKISHRACVMQLQLVRSTLMKSNASRDQPPRTTWRFALEKNLEVCKDGGCRVMTYNCRTYELYASQKSANYLFPGYGIRKVSCVDYKLGQFVHLHPKPIRDMTYSQPRDLLLSVGLDSTARVVDRGAPSLTVQCGMPLWSCSWDSLRTNEFYVGGVGGVVQQYDVRNPDVPVQRLSVPEDLSPVVSLCSTEFGLLSCQLNSCRLWMYNMGRWEARALPVEGPFMSMSYDAESQRALVSCRPGAGGADRARLTLCRLRGSTTGDLALEAEQSYAGSSRTTIISRATWVRAQDATWLAAHSESDSTLNLHGLDGSRAMSLPSSDAAFDVCSLQLNGSTMLAALSDSRLRIYRAIPTTISR
ncbi:E3 ubiquitin-protein ligase rfwd3.S-like [Battus philenor]|uniref:E3 ubiquitin-protein ligase rfwd3.S-like n=1 Tax=Battus philenor TaxID=42288 RepID=UPI0035D062F0